MPQTSVLASNHPHSGRFSIPVSNPLTRAVWTIVIVITVVTEVMPIPLMPPLPFYSYVAVKLICFFALGYLAPLAFWRFNALNRGILLAAISATAVETLQGLLHHGHSFHWYELVVKLVVILLGFALALDARYEGKVSLGVFHIWLKSDHLDS